MVPQRIILYSKLRQPDPPKPPGHAWSRYQINTKLDELKEQWRIEKTALELSDAQRDIKEVRTSARDELE